MFYRLFIIACLFITTTPQALTAEEFSPENAVKLIEYAISKQKNDPDTANNALEQAYYLANKQKNNLLIAKVRLEQAQTAKLQKDYFLAQQYLHKAEQLLPIVNDNDLAVQILTNMSSIQRYLKNFDSSMDYVQKALAIAKENQEPALIFKSLNIKGTLLKRMKRKEDSLSTYLSAQRYIANVNDEEKVRLFRDIAYSYNKLNEHESAIRYYNKALKTLTSTNNTKSLPKTLIELSKTQNKISLYANALENINLSLSIAREFKDEKYILKSLVVLSIIYRKLSSYEEALVYGLEALEIYQRKQDLNGIAAASNSIGLIYTHLNQKNNAKSYFEAVIKLPKQKIQAKYRAAALRDLGLLVFVNEKNKLGLNLSNDAFAIYEKLGDKKGVATVQKNMGYIYHQMGNLTEAMNSYNSAIHSFKNVNDLWDEAQTKAQLSLIMLENDIDKAIKLANESLKQASDIGAKSIEVEAYTSLILAEEKRGYYKKALAYAKHKEALINDIKTNSLNKRLAEMHIILDVEKKEKALEILKREKEVISLELNNKKNILSLLEKEKTINELKNQNTFIILCITATVVILCLFIIGRRYFNMQYRFILTTIAIVALLLFSLKASSADIIKLTQAQSNLDVRPHYTHAILKEALEISSAKYGDYEIRVLNHSLNNLEQIMEVHEGEYINLTMAMTSPDWEYLAIPIRIPLRRGVSNYRLLAINKHNQDNFKNINTVDDLKALTVGLKTEWISNGIMEEQGFKIVESLSYDGVFRMLDKMRFDFVPRSIHEAFEEIELRKGELKNIMIEPNLALYIPQPYYIFVSPKYPRIAERIEYGLEKMIAAGILQKLFDEHYGGFIKRANLADRKIIHMGNKFLTQKTPVERKELWLIFDLDKK